MTRGLLDRLAEGDRRLRGDQALLQSVLHNLRTLLNTHHDDSVTCPDFGIPDLTDSLHTFPAGLGSVREHLEAAVKRYEPRLTNVSVQLKRLSEDRLTIHFEVHGCLTQNPSRGVRFGTRVRSGCHIEVDETP